MLQQILKYTNKDHIDYDNLTNALVAVTDVTICIDKTKNEIIGLKRLGEISEILIVKNLSELQEYIEGKPHKFKFFLFNVNTTCNYCYEQVKPGWHFSSNLKYLNSFFLFIIFF